VNNVLVDDTTTTIPLPTVETDAAPRWRLITRIAFRLCFIYFGLYILLTQMLQAMVRKPSATMHDFLEKSCTVAEGLQAFFC